ALALLGGALAGCTASPTPMTSPRATQTQPATALQQQLATLEARATRIEDINAIKRLQRAYGYYFDEGLWDEMADLFAADASLEMGLDGVYLGRERIRAYLQALGGGRRGRRRGELHQHLQLMPVITVHADGHTANGTWRDLMLIGQLGRDAFWGEGPSENVYVKDAGVWKISRVQAFRTLLVPYEGGWLQHADVSADRAPGQTLPPGAPWPDAPPAMAYQPWPGTFTPPFHFRGRYPGLLPLAAAPVPDDPPGRVAARAAALRQRVQRLADQDAVENLQRIYGFYLDKGLWGEAAALFTSDAVLEIQGRGTFHGQARILEYLQAIGPEGAVPGRLYEQMQLQPITDVAADGRTARARWRVFSQQAQHGQFHEWASAILENEYRREAGVWKIHRMHVYPGMITSYESGWGRESLPASRFEPVLSPDEPARGPSSVYDTDFCTPFHFRHPVRGAVGTAAAPAPITGGSVPLAALLEESGRVLGAVEDRASIENLQTAYGYYLATLLWDDLAALFAENGTIEIALRGVYVGRASVRRNLDLYGQAGLDAGVLHNHMQFQMVIHVAGEGRSARLRSRAFSMMGNFRRNAMWMGGIYENQFVKVGDRWMFLHDQVINTYFATYETGWKDLAQRAPPGITASNPPDRPPSITFEMYPKNYLVPFHYANPVTGRRYGPP
ncbi:MAG: nuclear transport factor 2 family protein, partial [Gammaproteobacteria bacterium]|nr:nuclear transport factor 2 family protein [Gammaproteobacteria bacterium]